MRIADFFCLRTTLPLQNPYAERRIGTTARELLAM